MSLQSTLFGSTKYKPIRISDPLQTSIDTTSGESLTRYRRRKGETLDAFQGLVDRTQPKVESATDAGIGDINAASNIVRSFDPTGAYERLRLGNIKSLTGLTDTLSGVGRRQEAQLAARLGLGGRPMSSARDLLRSTNLAAAFAPVANTIYGNLGRDVGVLGNQTTDMAAALTKLAYARPDLYGNLYQYALAPLQAEQAGLQGETDALTALGNAVRQNYAGMDVQKQMGILDYPLRISENIAGTVGNLADAAGSVMGVMGGIGGLGGMAGGLGGMFGGGGGGGTASAPNLNWGSWSPAMGGGMGYNPYGGGMGFGGGFGYPGGGFNFGWGGSPSAMDVNMMNPLQWAMLQRAQQYGAQNVPAGSTWE